MTRKRRRRAKVQSGGVLGARLRRLLSGGSVAVSAGGTPEVSAAVDRNIDETAGRYLSYIDSEIEAESSFKVSLENKAFALITANLGVATLFLAVAAQLNRLTALSTGVPSAWATVALWVASSSIVLGVLAAVPVWVSGASDENELQVLKDLRNGRVVDPIASQLDIIDVKTKRLHALRKGNGYRGWVILASFVAFGVAASCLLVALLSG